MNYTCIIFIVTYNLMFIIGLCGSKGSGKDTFANYLLNNDNYIKISFADYIKSALSVLFDWDASDFNQCNKEKDDDYWGVSPRTMLQQIGTEFFRDHCQNIISPDFNLYNGKNHKASFHIKRLNKDITKLYNINNKTNIVISDIRFQDEIDYIKCLGGIIIKINRHDSIKNSYSNHASESQIDNLKNIDIVIENNHDINHYIKKIRVTVEHIQVHLQNDHDSVI